jgi:hypothetical protein
VRLPAGAYTCPVRRRVAVCTALLLAAAAGATPELNIQLHDGTIDIRVRQVPLQQVLDQLAQKTGMKIVYDTEPPQDQISLELTGLGVPAAVTEILRGHGLHYVTMMDKSGQRVETLLLTHGASGAVRPQAAAAPPPNPEEHQEYYEEPQEYPEPPPPPEQTPPPTPPPGPVFAPGTIIQPGGGIPGISNIGGVPPPSAPAQVDPVPPSMEGHPQQQPQSET